MKLPDYAKAIGISYTTAWRWWKANKLPHPARQTESGLIIVDYVPQTSSTEVKKNRVAIYSRVSSSENKENLNRQSERLTEYAIANGYQIVRNVKEIGSGLNDHRKQLETLLQQNDYDILLVEHKDRLGRFGTNYLGVLLLRLGVKLEIVNLADNGKDELMQDLVAIITSFAARLYGQRRATRKTEKIIAELKDGDSECN
ncbi:IS607 family transposase [Microcoleus sp. D2_18a_B4]|uniref:IS607 family transposase n=1 Tax=Microcoleus sp. D2_18a_B4 TaxID=3055329 RepID=UPI002FD305A0